MSSFTVKAEELSAALNLVLNSAGVKTTMPWLSFVLIDAHEDKLKLCATDMDMSISVSIPAEVKTQGAFCVKAKQLANLSALLSGDAEIELKNDQVWVKMATAKHRLPYLPKEEFHFIETAKDEKLTISGEVLAGMLRSASIAMETNPNGKDSWKNLELCAKGGKFQITGMCGPRAATTNIPCESEFYVMLPSKAVTALIAFASQSETLSLAIAENCITARFGENEATFKIQGIKWADWSSIVEAECQHQIEIDSESFVPALKRAILSADHQSRLVTRVEFRLSGQSSDLFSESVNGEGTENLSFTCASLNGETLPIALDGAQLLDLFRVVKGGVLWEFSQNHAALRFTPKEPLLFSFTYVQGTLRI